MTLCRVGIVAHPLFGIRPRCGKVALGRFDVAASEGDAALVKCFREVSDARKIFQRRIGQNLFCGGIVALQHGQVPVRRSQQSVAIIGGGNVFQNFSTSRGIVVAEHFDVSKADLGISRIWCYPQCAVVARSRPSPITHKKVGVGRS